MAGRRSLAFALPLLALAVAGVGCQSTQLGALQSQHRTLTEQSRAQLAEIENLKVHSRRIEDQLISAEQQLAQMDAKFGADQQQLARFERERQQMQDRFAGLSQAGGPVPVGLAGRLADLSRRYPSLRYDPETGASKLDEEILFDSAESTLKPDAERMLEEFAQILQSPEARGLKVMVVGHTDELKIARKEARERHPDNWHLSTSRALAVVDYLRKSGIPDEQMGVAGFGGHQPVASNLTALDRRRNRRVEIFLLGPEVPVVGWTESTTSLY